MNYKQTPYLCKKDKEFLVAYLYNTYYNEYIRLILIKEDAALQTNIELFTRKYIAQMTFEGNGVQVSLVPESVEELKEYLQIVLPYYTVLPEGDLTLPDLLQIANQWQFANPDEKLSEPKTKLPQDVDIRIAFELKEISNATGISQAQLITTMINKFYKKVVKEQHENNQ